MQPNTVTGAGRTRALSSGKDCRIPSPWDAFTQPTGRDVHAQQAAVPETCFQHFDTILVKPRSLREKVRDFSWVFHQTTGVVPALDRYQFQAPGGLGPL